MNGNAPAVKEINVGDIDVHRMTKKGYKRDNFNPEVLPTTFHVKPEKSPNTLKLMMELKLPAFVIDYCTKLLTFVDTRLSDSDIDSNLD